MGNLKQASKEISAQDRIAALATNVNLNYIIKFNLRAMFNIYLEQGLIRRIGRLSPSTTTPAASSTTLRRTMMPASLFVLNKIDF